MRAQQWCGGCPQCSGQSGSGCTRQAASPCSGGTPDTWAAQTPGQALTLCSHTLHPGDKRKNSAF